MINDEHLNTGSMALDALPADEAAAFADHVRTCSTCAAEYASFLETAAILGGSVAQTPPASLRSSVMRAVATTAQLPPLTSPGAQSVQSRPDDRPAARESYTSTAEPGSATVTPLHRPWYRRPQTLLAAAVAAVVVGGGTTAVLHNRSSAPPSAQACVAAARDRSVIAPTVGSGGNVLLAPSCDTAVVNIPSLPTPPAGKVYQVWVMKGASARSVQVMNNRLSGPTPITTTVHAGDRGIGVSVEPAPGSPKPTTAPFWVVPLAG